MRNNSFINGLYVYITAKGTEIKSVSEAVTLWRNLHINDLMYSLEEFLEAFQEFLNPTREMHWWISRGYSPVFTDELTEMYSPNGEVQVLFWKGVLEEVWYRDEPFNHHTSKFKGGGIWLDKTQALEILQKGGVRV